MTKAQYKRLVLVLFIPLVICGIYLYNKDVFFEKNAITDCEYYEAGWWCYAHPVPEWQMMEAYGGLGKGSRGGVWVSDKIHLKGDFVAGIAAEEYSSNKPLPASEWNKYNLGSPPNKLFIDRNRGSDTWNSNLLPCQLQPFSNIPYWSFQCGHNGDNAVSFKFQFLDKAVEEKYRMVIKLGNEKAKEYKEFSDYCMIAVILSPLLSFFGLTLLYLLLRRIVRFVVGTGQSQGVS